MAPDVLTMSAAETGARVKVKTLIKGEIEVDESHVLEFVSPLVGFEDYTRYVLFQTNEGPMYWLQSVDEPDVSFAVLAPFEAGLDPDMAIGMGDVGDVDAESVEDVAVYTMVVLDEDQTKIRTNLRAPIILGRRSRKAKQLILDDPNLPIQFFLHQHLQKKIL